MRTFLADALLHDQTRYLKVTCEEMKRSIKMLKELGNNEASHDAAKFQAVLDVIETLIDKGE